MEEGLLTIGKTMGDFEITTLLGRGGRGGSLSGEGSEIEKSTGIGVGSRGRKKPIPIPRKSKGNCMIGKTLGHSQITSQIGKGGIFQSYKPCRLSLLSDTSAG
jgi:hypothetical protein